MSNSIVKAGRIGIFHFVELMGWVAGRSATRMYGAKGCGSGAASLARPVRSELHSQGAARRLRMQ